MSCVWRKNDLRLPNRAKPENISFGDALGRLKEALYHVGSGGTTQRDSEFVGLLPQGRLGSLHGPRDPGNRSSLLRVRSQFTDFFPRPRTSRDFLDWLPLFHNAPLFLIGGRCVHSRNERFNLIYEICRLRSGNGFAGA
jgi:hypothetical protein